MKMEKKDLLTFAEAVGRFAPGTHPVVLWTLFKHRGIKAQKRRSVKSWLKLFKLLATQPKIGGRMFARSSEGERM